MKTRSLVAALLGMALTAHAEQYKSEVRDLPGTPPPSQPQDAQKLLQAAKDPYERALLLRELAAKAATAGDYAGAAKYLGEAIRQNALSPQAAAQMRKDLTQLLVAGGNPAEVIRALEPQVRGNPDADAGQQAALGGAYLQLQRYQDALPLLQRAVAATPNPDESWLAALYAAQVHAGQPRQAIAVLEKLVRRNPGNRDYWLALAGLLHDAGDKERALAALELASRLGHLPDEQGRLQLVGLTAQLGAPFEAGSLMQGWMDRGELPRSARNYEVLGGFWLAARESRLAVAALNEAQALAHDPGRARLLDQLDVQDDAETVALSGRLLGGTVSAVPGTGADLVDTRPDPRRIGGALTEVGAERDGNADGSIPAWTGGLAAPPPAWKKGGRLVDPFPGDAPLFTITAANAAQHAAKLSPGHRALLSRYPDFRMPVYVTRRSAAFPPAIYEATAANRGKARLVGSDALVDARLGFPFPQPQNGVEVMWNHRTRYRGDSFVGVTSQAVVARNGVSHRNKGVFRVLFRYGNAAKPADINDENIICYGVSFVGERANDTNADFVVLFHESANSIRKSRAIWVLLGKVGRMLRLPPLGYDQPMYGTDGIYFIDMIDMYNGAFDRYVWKLVGKRELYIPYNAYRLNDGSQKYAQQLAFPAFGAQNARYELHRVWVVEATERGGKTHVFGKRTFYVDEDSWNVVLVENQDRAGKLWRFQEGHLLTSYDVGSTNAYPIVTYDLKDERYFVHRLLAEDPPLQFNVPMRDQEFLPASVQARYSR
jgi:tetratricopeptide (TPR) repeat protein